MKILKKSIILIKKKWQSSCFIDIIGHVFMKKFSMKETY